MSFKEPLNLIQFRAAYNLPVHAAIETGIFARCGLAVEIAYTSGSQHLIQVLRKGEFDIGHTSADDVIADVESDGTSDLFLFMGLHSGLFSLVGSADCASIESLLGKSIGVDASGSGFALVLEKMLRSQGFGRKDYRLIEIGGWEHRYLALLEEKISATLLTEPYVANALAAGCHLLAKDAEMMPVYQGTCGAASRRWAQQHAEHLSRYIRAYVEATQWCLELQNRRFCLDILGRHNGIDGAVAEKTLDALLDRERGLYPRAALNTSGVAAALDLRGELGYRARPAPPVQKYLDLSYYRRALAISR
jgi:NitT/TauT family transport system substrate-binding protein